MSDVGVSLGFFGNIWLRENILHKKGSLSDRHYHLFDHITFLTRGEAKVVIEGQKSEGKTFKAPCIIVMKKDLHHTFEALTDDVRWFCVFAVRDSSGEVMEFIPDNWNPSYDSAMVVDKEYWKKRKILEDLSIEIDHQPYPSWIWNKDLKKWVAPVPYPVDGKLYDWHEPTNEWLELFPHHPFLQE